MSLSVTIMIRLVRDGSMKDSVFMLKKKKSDAIDRLTDSAFFCSVFLALDLGGTNL